MAAFCLSARPGVGTGPLNRAAKQLAVRRAPSQPSASATAKRAVVESVNRAGDHAAAQRIIGTTKTLTPEEAADPAFDLRGLAKR